MTHGLVFSPATGNAPWVCRKRRGSIVIGAGRIDEASREKSASRTNNLQPEDYSK